MGVAYRHAEPFYVLPEFYEQMLAGLGCSAARLLTAEAAPVYRHADGGA